MNNPFVTTKLRIEEKYRWKHFFLFLSILGFVFLSCKSKEPLPDQIKGTRFSSFNQWIYSKPNTIKKEDQVALVYGFEEVTALGSEEIEITDKSEKKKVEYLKIRTVDQKEGYAPSSGFVEAIVFIIQDGLDAFIKPTYTAGTKGKLSRGTYCLLKETIGEFSRVDCKEAILPEGKVKLEDYWNVWIAVQTDSTSKDPLLGETIKLMRQASLDMIKLTSASNEDGNKLRISIQDNLNKALEKEDLFLEDIRNLLNRSQSN
jgi:lipoprotein LenA